MNVKILEEAGLQIKDIYRLDINTVKNNLVSYLNLHPKSFIYTINKNDNNNILPNDLKLDYINSDDT